MASSSPEKHHGEPTRIPLLKSTNPFSILVHEERATEIASANGNNIGNGNVNNFKNNNDVSGRRNGKQSASPRPSPTVTMVSNHMFGISEENMLVESGDQGDERESPPRNPEPNLHTADTIYAESQDYYENELFEVDPVCFASVLFDYMAVNEDELSLRKGESVMVFSKDDDITGDMGWWLGKIGTRVGVFPLNYVEEAPNNSFDSIQTKPSLFEIREDEVVKHKLIGVGGFGRVFFGTYARKAVAIKELICSGVSERDIHSQYDQLRLEAELLAVFSHKNVTQLYGVISSPPCIKMVMEYAAGGSLSSVLVSNYLERSVVLDWAFQISRGLNYLHNESPVAVVHRDLKSPNVLLTQANADGTLVTSGNILKITDFGLARRCIRSVHESGTKGTYQWMAPECIRVGSYSPASDIWGYGVLVWELLTSQVPYAGLPWQTVAYMVGVGGSSLPIPTECPEPFDEILRVCWSKDPCDRPNVEILVSRLQEAMSVDDTANTTLGKSKWGEMQLTWKEEMATRFKNLEKTEKEMETQQSALRGIQRRQTQHQRELDDWETALAKREMELQYRELTLMVNVPSSTDQRPTPVRRKTKHGPRVVKKTDIGQPREFKHVMHLSNDGTPSQADSGGIAASPILANSKSISPPMYTDHHSHSLVADHVVTHKCPGCLLEKSATNSTCKACNTTLSCAKNDKNSGKSNQGGIAIGPFFRRSTSSSRSRSPRSSSDLTTKSYSVLTSSSCVDKRDVGGTLDVCDSNIVNRQSVVSNNNDTDNVKNKNINKNTNTDNNTTTTTTHNNTNTNNNDDDDDDNNDDDDDNYNVNHDNFNNSHNYCTDKGDVEHRRLYRLASLPSQTRMFYENNADTEPLIPRSSSLSDTSPSPKRGIFARSRYFRRSSSSNPTSPIDKKINFRWQHDPSVNWFYPKMSKEDTRNYLRGKPCGSFVVRVSKSNQSCLAICAMQERQKMWHGLIVYNDGAWQLGMLLHEQEFQTPLQLVDYYTQHAYDGNHVLVKTPTLITDYALSPPPPRCGASLSSPIAVATGRVRSLSSMDLMQTGRSPPTFSDYGSQTSRAMSDEEA